MISLVIETWNLDGQVAPLGAVLERVAPDIARLDAELVITHTGIPENERDRLAASAGCRIAWVALEVGATYYEHKNRGFVASSGDIVAFLDGDCTPTAGWLSALTAPFAEGARVVAGATSYPGPVAPIANAIDFPYFDGETARRTSIDGGRPPPTVRNFFANNVAFARDVFAERNYPAIAAMFHGQCQILALRLHEAGIPVHLAAGARVTHAWPDGLRAWLAVRLLRGADTVSLLPYLLDVYAPRIAPTARRLGPLPALAVFAARAAGRSWTAVRHGPTARGLGFVALATVLDAIGAAATSQVYRRYGVTSSSPGQPA